MLFLWLPLSIITLWFLFIICYWIYRYYHNSLAVGRIWRVWLGWLGFRADWWANEMSCMEIRIFVLHQCLLQYRYRYPNLDSVTMDSYSFGCYPFVAVSRPTFRILQQQQQQQQQRPCNSQRTYARMGAMEVGFKLDCSVLDDRKMKQNCKVSKKNKLRPHL